jgi:outer membrane protein OmpA-like peptidoglycan-associated protein
MKKSILLGMIALIVLSGCAGHRPQTENAATIGAAGVGQMMDHQEADMRDALAASEAAAVRREGALLAITLKGDISFDLNADVVRPGLYAELDRIARVFFMEFRESSLEFELQGWIEDVDA